MAWKPTAGECGCFEWRGKSAKIVIVVTSVLTVLLTMAGCGFSATGADGDKTQASSTGTDKNRTPAASVETSTERTPASSTGTDGDKTPAVSTETGVERTQAASAGADGDRIPAGSTGAGGDKVSAVSVAAESTAGAEPEIAREDEKPEIPLEHIEWQDYTNNDSEWDETKLFFTFNNGESAELTVLYSPSIVEKIEYEDITGDGTAEVLVYRYFANTATEYTLIDIIEVKDGIVKNISPETEIAELADEVWNTTIEDFTVDGYTCPVLRMESFRKEPCISYLDRVYLVGYKDGKWQIIQELPGEEPE